MEHNHEKMLDMVRHELPTDELLCDLSDLFRLFGDTTRVKILFSLFESEMCVCAIAELLGMTQSAVSDHIQRLEEFTGVQLFHRTGRSATLNAAGEALRGDRRSITSGLLAAAVLPRYRALCERLIARAP